MRISDWSSDVCSSDLLQRAGQVRLAPQQARERLALLALRRPHREECDERLRLPQREPHRLAIGVRQGKPAEEPQCGNGVHLYLLLRLFRRLPQWQPAVPSLSGAAIGAFGMNKRIFVTECPSLSLKR